LFIKHRLKNTGSCCFPNKVLPEPDPVSIPKPQLKSNNVAPAPDTEPILEDSPTTVVYNKIPKPILPQPASDEPRDRREARAAARAMYSSAAAAPALQRSGRKERDATLKK